MTETIREGAELALEMAIHDDQGELLERTDDGHPFRCRFGVSELPPGVERELEGRAVGYEFDLLLAPADAFGEHDPAQVISIPRDELPPETDVEVGDLLPVLLEPEPGEEGEEEEVELPVVAVDDEAVTVDLNHPYAGMRLRFSGRVVEID